MSEQSQRTVSQRADVAAEMLDGLDEGYHYATLAYDEAGRVVEVAWNYDRAPGAPSRNDDFADRERSKERRSLAVAHQRQFEESEKHGTEQAKLVTDGGRDRQRPPIKHARECDECGVETYQYERCHVCGDVPWDREVPA